MTAQASKYNWAQPNLHPALRATFSRREKGKTALATLLIRLGNVMKHFSRSILVIALASIMSIAQAATPPPKQNADLDRLVDAVVAYYHLPGLAVGVIDHGKVVYTREV